MALVQQLQMLLQNSTQTTTMAIQITAPNSLPDNEIIQMDFQGKDQQRCGEGSYSFTGSFGKNSSQIQFQIETAAVWAHCGWLCF